MGTIILIALLALFIIDVVCFSLEKYTASVTIMIASIAGAYFFQPEVHAFVATGGWFTILTKYVPFYLLGGIITALVKWVLYNLKRANKIRDIKAKFDVSAPLVENQVLTKDQAADRRKKFLKFYTEKFGHDIHTMYEVDHQNPASIVDALTPRAKDNVGLITLWIFQWPVVIVEMLIADFLIKLGKHIARLFDRLFSFFGRLLVARASRGL